MGISEPFDAPFHGGEVVISQEEMWPLPISIGGRRYICEWEGFQRQTVSPFREARDSNALPGEQTLNPLGAWKRTRSDWSLGAGQVWADRALEPFNVRIEIEPRQFYKSKGIDPWTPNAITLLPDTQLAIASINSLKLVSLGSWLYFLDGNTLKRTSNPDATTPTVATLTGLTGTIKDFTTDGQRVYISTTTGMFVSDSSVITCTALPGAAATYSPAIVQWANGWLWGCDANKIREVRADGTVNLIFTHLNANFTFAAITGSPGFSYFAGQSADVNEIYRVGTKTDGTLGPGIYSGSVPKGFSVRALGYYGSFVLVCASNGFHLAAIAGDGSLSISPVIDTSSDVRCCIPEGKYVWFGWTAYDSTSTGLGRVDLSSFSDIDNLVPAWATDLMYTNQGQVTSVARYNRKTYFAIAGVGIVRQHATNKVPQGQLDMGRFRWGTYEPKAWIGIEIVSDPLAGNTDGIISATVLDDTTAISSVGQRGPGNASTGIGRAYGLGIVSETHDWYEPTLILSRPPSNAAVAPIVRRVSLRALPTPMLLEQFTIPIKMSETILSQTQEGQDISYVTYAEYNFLQSLILEGKIVTFQLGLEQFLVTVREITWDKVWGMNSNRSSVEGIITVSLVTAEY
jgi:hypothetical protein